jgi:hypothetical protein
MIGKYDIVSTSPHQVSATLGNEVVLLELQAGTYFGVNDVGTAVWKYLQQPRHVSDVIAYVVNQYEVPIDRAESEILGFLQNLADEGLVVVERGSKLQTP